MSRHTRKYDLIPLSVFLIVSLLLCFYYLLIPVNSLDHYQKASILCFAIGIPGIFFRLINQIYDLRGDYKELYLRGELSLGIFERIKVIFFIIVFTASIIDAIGISLFFFRISFWSGMLFLFVCFICGFFTILLLRLAHHPLSLTHKEHNKQT